MISRHMTYTWVLALRKLRRHPEHPALSPSLQMLLTGWLTPRPLIGHGV